MRSAVGRSTQSLDRKQSAVPERKRRILGITLGAILLIVGLGTAVSSKALLSMCRSDCWFNGLLYAFFGEHWGKFLLGGIWYLAGVWFIYRGVFGWHSASNRN